MSHRRSAQPPDTSYDGGVAKATTDGGRLGHEELGWSLGVVLRHYQDEVGQVLADVPQGHRGFQVLASVVHGDQRSQLALAGHLGIDRTVMTYVVDDLVAAVAKAGYVARPAAF